LVTLIETLPLIFERFTLKNPLAGFGETATAGSDCSVLSQQLQLQQQLCR
jgi:hypothetical protein